MAGGIPAFARIEITLRSRADIRKAVAGLHGLSYELEAIVASPDSDEAARLLAVDKIRATSKKLRNPDT